MKYLMTQDEFEQLIGRQPVPDGTTLPHFTIIYFGATWCGPCQRLDMAGLEAALPEVNWLKCDVDQNKYTPGYCGIRSIPSFLAVVDTKIVGQLQSSDTNKVAAWVKTLLEDAVEPQG